MIFFFREINLLIKSTFINLDLTNHRWYRKRGINCGEIKWLVQVKLSLGLQETMAADGSFENAHSFGSEITILPLQLVVWDIPVRRALIDHPALRTFSVRYRAQTPLCFLNAPLYGAFGVVTAADDATKSLTVSLDVVPVPGIKALVRTALQKQQQDDGAYVTLQSLARSVGLSPRLASRLVAMFVIDTTTGSWAVSLVARSVGWLFGCLFV